MSVGVPYFELTPLSKIHDVLYAQGFAIIEDQWKDEVWSQLEQMITPSLNRDDPKTYNNFYHFKPEHNMLLQHWGIGHLKCVWEARSKASQIYSHIWNVQPSDLLTSFDGIGFQIAPEKYPQRRGSFKNDPWFHCDQSYRDLSFKCVQGFWNLQETGEHDACLSVLQGSHLHRQEFRNQFFDFDIPRPNWYLLNQTQKHWYQEVKKCEWRFICPPKGSFVCWLSNTIHCGTESRWPRPVPRDRLVFYISQLPRFKWQSGQLQCSGASQTDLDQRIRIYERSGMTSHWCYPVSEFPPEPAIYGYTPASIVPIEAPSAQELSPLQKRLIGYT